MNLIVTTILLSTEKSGALILEMTKKVNPYVEERNCTELRSRKYSPLQKQHKSPLMPWPYFNLIYDEGVVTCLSMTTWQLRKTHYSTGQEATDLVHKLSM